jgi:hypothetical protein
MDIQCTLDEMQMIGIYKTTTKTSRDSDGTLLHHDEHGCCLLHYCLYFKWTAELSQLHYWDTYHFLSHVNS